MKLFTLCELIDLPGRGRVIAGTNPLLDDLPTQAFRQLVGQRIEVRGKNGSVKSLAVADVVMHESLIGKKNLFILLVDSNAVGQDDIGADVFALTDAPR